MKKYFSGIVILLTSFTCLKAQDLHLTQYLTSNLTLNPALTGYYEGDYRFTLNHRNQWRQLPSPMVTNQFTVEKRIKRFDREIGLGAMLINDDVRDLNLTTNKFILSGSYQVEKNDHLIRGGLQSGFNLRQSGFSQQTFPSQWNYSLGVFDDNLSNNEIGLQGDEFYVDINAGLSWAKYFNKWKLNVGFAGYHLNRPKTGFVNGSDKLRLSVRKVANIRADYNFSESLVLTPTLLYMFTTKTKDLLLGLMGTVKLSNAMRAGLGVSYRGEGASSDALIPTFMLGYKRFDFGFSNDYNLSGLSDGGRKSSYEISIIYTTPSATSSRATIPCERI